jgi:hypothetical protein
MSHRVNIILEDEIWSLLSSLPQGERSKFVNSAVSEAFKARLRMSAYQKIQTLRKTNKALPSGTIVDWLREDRGR